MSIIDYMVDLQHSIGLLKRMHVLPEHSLQEILELAMDILIEESNVVEVESPVTLVGDIHGQMKDLLHLLEIGGQPPDRAYLFMGDYVDRGYHSIETLSLLVCLKVAYPSRITLLRGNHECRAVSSVYGFYDECVRKYGNANVWGMCQQLFDCLPLAGVVDGSTMVVHGGLSPEVRTIDQIRAIDRNMEIPSIGPIRDLLWSDPEDLPEQESWRVSKRGAGWLFGHGVTQQFCHLNGLSLIVRAHQLVQEGYKYWFGPENLVLSLWSAPNYCYRCGNVAAILTIREKERTIQVFESMPGQSVQNVLPYFL